MLFSALFNAVCLHNAYFLLLTFSYAFCFHALSCVIDTVCLFQILFCFIIIKIIIIIIKNETNVIQGATLLRSLQAGVYTCNASHSPPVTWVAEFYLLLFPLVSWSLSFKFFTINSHCILSLHNVL